MSYVGGVSRAVPVENYRTYYSPANKPGVPVEPVQPVDSVKAANGGAVQEQAAYGHSILHQEAGQPRGFSRLPSNETLLMQHENDPVAMSVRMRIQNPENPAAAVKGLPANADTAAETEGNGILPEIKSAIDAVEEAECQTCSNRKYQDGSDDPGVSFKTATKLSPEAAATAVRGHEMEHVVRERAAAEREDREVVSQSVRIHTDICPECGRVYVSGGVTETTTRSKPEENDAAEALSAENDPASSPAA